jgi:hypothetical protein
MRLDLDTKYVRDQITALLIAYPELSEDDALREDMVEGSTTTFEFLSKVVRLIGNNLSLANGTSSYIEELRVREERLKHRISVLRSLIYKIMTAADLSKVELAEATLSIRSGQSKVIITDESQLLDAYCRIKREPDKTLIKTTLKSGGVVTGAELSNAEPTLAILIK